MSYCGSCFSPPSACLCGHRCTVGVLAGTHRCALTQKVVQSVLLHLYGWSSPRTPRPSVSFHRFSFLSPSLSCVLSKTSRCQCENEILSHLRTQYFLHFIQSFPRPQSPQTFPRVCHHNLRFHPVWLHRSFSFPMFAWTFAWASTNSCFCTGKHFQGVHHQIGSFVANPSHVFSTHFWQSPHIERVNPSVSIISRSYWSFWCSGSQTHVSSFSLLRRNGRLIHSVSHPRIFSRCRKVHDQFSHPKEKTTPHGRGQPIFDI